MKILKLYVCFLVLIFLPHCSFKTRNDYSGKELIFQAPTPLSYQDAGIQFAKMARKAAETAQKRDSSDFQLITSVAFNKDSKRITESITKVLLYPPSQESTSHSCPFCSIIDEKSSPQIIEKNNYAMAIKKLRPVANVNFLIIPIKHIANLKSFIFPENNLLLTKMFEMALAIAQNGSAGRFRLQINNGKNAGQSVFHTHMHITMDDPFLIYKGKRIGSRNDSMSKSPVK